MNNLTDPISEHARAVVQPGTEVVVHGLPGPADYVVPVESTKNGTAPDGAVTTIDVIGSAYLYNITLGQAIETARQADREGYDAYVIGSGVTKVALRVADDDGLEAVSMRRVAAELGTGAASLYRYVETREDLLVLMTDAIGAEYELAPPSSNWLADLIAFGEQARVIFRRHRWLAGLAMTRPVIGPNGIGLIEHFLTVLQRHPASTGAKMEAFAMLNGITAAFALQEQADPGLQARNLAYLGHALTSGGHPRLAALLSPQAQLPPPEELTDRYPDLIARVLTGLLGPA